MTSSIVSNPWQPCYKQLWSQKNTLKSNYYSKFDNGGMSDTLFFLNFKSYFVTVALLVEFDLYFYNTNGKFKEMSDT